MNLFNSQMKELGYNSKISELIGENVDHEELARVIAEHKERYTVQNDEGILSAEITGNMRFSARSRADLPAVGDWVRITKMDQQNAIILECYPRYSVLERKAVGKTGELQIIAANIDHAFIVMAVGHDFNLNRMERYLVTCRNGNIHPIVLLTKTDLVSELEKEELQGLITKRAPGVTTLAVSNETGDGFDELQGAFKPYRTFCFIGSSGVGKSTVINRLRKSESILTSAVSASTGKGKHTTTHRELMLLPNKSIVIDTPGMRGLGIASGTQGLEQTFDAIAVLSKQCRFADCKHENETGCAVLHAVDNGELAEEAYQNYMKLRREKEHFESTVHEKRKKGREFGKMVKEVSKFKKNNKF